MNVLKFVDRWLEKISGWMLVFFLGVMIVMAFGQVVLRNFFHTGIEWGDIFLRHLVLWVGFFGAVIATGERRHLKIEFLTKLVRPKVRKIFFVITNLFAGFICYLLMQAAIAFVNLEGESGSTLILNLPTTYFIIIIPIGYAIVSFRFVVHAIQWIEEIVKGNWEISEVQHL
ncbi:MAG: TRAP transporter small permease [Bacteroidota bacterium]|nr:TRAP transporter small permease [Bacteroidota bacterium]